MLLLVWLLLLCGDGDVGGLRDLTLAYIGVDVIGVVVVVVVVVAVVVVAVVVMNRRCRCLLL